MVHFFLFINLPLISFLNFSLFFTTFALRFDGMKRIILFFIVSLLPVLVFAKKNTGMSVVEHRAYIQTRYLYKLLVLTDNEMEEIYKLNVQYNQEQVSVEEKSSVKKKLVINQLLKEIPGRNTSYEEILTPGQYAEFKSWVENTLSK